MRVLCYMPARSSPALRVEAAAWAWLALEGLNIHAGSSTFGIMPAPARHAPTGGLGSNASRSNEHAGSGGVTPARDRTLNGVTAAQERTLNGVMTAQERTLNGVMTAQERTPGAAITAQERTPGGVTIAQSTRPDRRAPPW